MRTLAATKRLALVCCTALIGLSAIEATAQAPIPRRPSAVNRPALSPYLDLLRERTGPLPQFHQFYRPRVEQQQRQFRARQQLGQIQRRLGNQPRR